MQKHYIKWNYYYGAIMASRSTVIFKMSYFQINFFLLLFYVSIAVLLNSCSTIYSAAQDGNLEKVKNFVEKGKNINDPKNFSGTTPLSAAANHGHLEVVKYLVSNGADVNMQKDGFILSYSNKIAVDNYKYKISIKSFYTQAGMGRF